MSGLTALPHAQTAADVVREDLAAIRSGLREDWSRLVDKHVLIAGGAGFLGYYLVQTLLGDGPAPARVTVLDNFQRGLPDWLAALRHHPRLRLLRHDVTQPLPEAEGPFDFIIHAATIASPIYYRKFPLETMDANVTGLRLLLDRAVAQARDGHPVAGFLFFSTSEIYGDPDAAHIPTPETYRGNVSCTGPRACYDESKRYGETLCVNFAAQRGLPVTIARPFNNYGPGLKITDRRVLPDFARDILAGRDIVMLSDGSPSRTFCYITDAIIGYFKILLRGRPGESYNIGAESPEITMAELARRVAALGRELTGYTGTVVLGRSPDAAYLTDNPNRRCPVIAKARTELDFHPVVPLDEGLRRALVWYRDNPAAEES
jgi:dTDP-glucose 4,6-dehydratase/UDP-glucuronate decarboxylase